jgi:hypothetical protein
MPGFARRLPRIPDALADWQRRVASVALVSGVGRVCAGSRVARSFRGNMALTPLYPWYRGMCPSRDRPLSVVGWRSPRVGSGVPGHVPQS